MIHTAVIVEPRNTILLIHVIQNILDKIPNILIHLFNGINNASNIHNYIKKNNLINKIKLTNLNKTNLTIAEYSDLLTSLSFWKQIKGENILIFQIDSWVCHYNKDFIKECSEYGFIGAPCRECDIPWQNGGLSLRKKSLMIKAIKDKKLNESTWPEDRFFTVIKRKIVNPAPFELAKKFSVEKYYYITPFGVHKPWNYLQENELEQIKKQYPEMSLIWNK
jgi:hypothetical protein